MKGLERMPKDNKDIKQIKELIGIMKENDLVEVFIEHGDDKLSLNRACAQTSMMPMPAPSQAGHTPAQGASDGSIEADDGLIDIPSPIVGTFYEAPTPDSTAYVEIGAHVGPDSVVCIIEAMKVMNEIKAEVKGTIKKILVDDATPVQFGQPLFLVDPA